MWTVWYSYVTTSPSVLFSPKFHSLGSYILSFGWNIEWAHKNFYKQNKVKIALWWNGETARGYGDDCWFSFEISTGNFRCRFSSFHVFGCFFLQLQLCSLLVLLSLLSIHVLFSFQFHACPGNISSNLWIWRLLKLAYKWNEKVEEPIVEKLNLNWVLARQLVLINLTIWLFLRSFKTKFRLGWRLKENRKEWQRVGIGH